MGLILVKDTALRVVIIICTHTCAHFTANRAGETSLERVPCVVWLCGLVQIQKGFSVNGLDMWVSPMVVSLCGFVKFTERGTCLLRSFFYPHHRFAVVCVCVCVCVRRGDVDTLLSRRGSRFCSVLLTFHAEL